MLDDDDDDNITVRNLGVTGRSPAWVIDGLLVFAITYVLLLFFVLFFFFLCSFFCSSAGYHPCPHNSTPTRWKNYDSSGFHL
jgi:hypothetical protein